jgi:hypothetical protein
MGYFMIKAAEMPPLSQQSVADLLCTIIILCRGKDENGKPIWAYLCMKPSMASAFKCARERGGFDIEDYGTVLESGNGEEPPAELKVRMERDYAVNHAFCDLAIAGNSAA